VGLAPRSPRSSPAARRRAAGPLRRPRRVATDRVLMCSGIDSARCGTIWPVRVTTSDPSPREGATTPGAGNCRSPGEVRPFDAGAAFVAARYCVRMAITGAVNVRRLPEGRLTIVRCISREYPRRINETDDVASGVTSSLRCKASLSDDPCHWVLRRLKPCGKPPHKCGCGT
jgi:hypothetical protein